MRIAVIGAGAIGGFYGAALSSAGQDVSFIARGATLEALRTHGLRIIGEQTLTLEAPATDDAATIGPVDVVLICTKTFQVADAAHTYLPALMGPDTLVVTTQNGVQAPFVLEKIIGREHVAPGVCRVWSKIAEPGVIDLMGGPKSLVAGTWDDAVTPVLSAFRTALHEAGIATTDTTDIWTELWTKVIHVVPQGAVGALLDAPLGQLLERHLPLYRRAMTETADVARAHGAHLPDDVVETTLGFVAGQDPTSTTSFQRDITAGRPSEFAAQVGAIPALGDEVGVDTPVNDVIAEVLGLAEERHRRA
ncbi:2-dehydropantoate 2-reductase [Acidipropionibacterium acidipropionici]|uniref:2-dehydropantoate 2-reductase n=1 Tax=Acidipropionibacterium acidipropionici TaxID=1748 RepID=A0AAC9AMX7_9ACTN|nr:2-dehydropantoate 2-reductase [Acidipropionibacterium acidipropionici]AMS04705.1 2-dehydropantoate 2-reductase [Acidipropionibacterium acidipropionici]AOZ46195.1 2-dehydropantoate 2-reductase [Acidipropionibacterium acidipropionici]AZP37778.1 2-dehydropantoate 2-reductase [Acidipropionibacterium acidipropionici]